MEGAPRWVLPQPSKITLAHLSNRQAPGDLGVGGETNQAILKELESHPGMKRLTGFIKSKHGAPIRVRRYSPLRLLEPRFGLGRLLTGSPSTGNLETYSPTLYEFTRAVLNLFELENPTVMRHHPGHPLASTTFNLGPKTCTFPHKDLKNLSWGWCSVTSLGNYDHTKGGHLVLWDLKLAIEFPPYSTILIPSAILMHSNTAIGADEERLTITQYSSAGLFAWQAYGNKPKGKSSKSPLFWWKKPLHMFSKMGELVARARA